MRLIKPPPHAHAMCMRRMLVDAGHASAHHAMVLMAKMSAVVLCTVPRCTDMHCVRVQALMCMVDFVHMKNVHAPDVNVHVHASQGTVSMQVLMHVFTCERGCAVYKHEHAHGGSGLASSTSCAHVTCAMACCMRPHADVHAVRSC